MLCIADEAGRVWVAGCSEQERGWVSRCGRESWLGLMQEVGVLQQPVVFGRAQASLQSAASLTLSENGAVATRNTN